MKAGLICLLTLVNLMSSCINRDKSFDGESFLVGTGACTVIHSDTLTCNCDLKEDTVYMRTFEGNISYGNRTCNDNGNKFHGYTFGVWL